ncbi:MAG: hypothetical protein ACLFUU_11225 [Desulfobacteraceae bacterium]
MELVIILYAAWLAYILIQKLRGRGIICNSLSDRRGGDTALEASWPGMVVLAQPCLAPNRGCLLA